MQADTVPVQFQVLSGPGLASEYFEAVDALSTFFLVIREMVP